MVNINTKPYSFWLSALLSLFIFRVSAQLIQAVHPFTFLPPFESWQSGALPYPALLICQVAIIGICVRVIIKMRAGAISPNEKLGLALLLFGGIYLLIMSFRLLAGLSFGENNFWLGALLPTIFHLVLASFVLLLGLFHMPIDKQLIRWIAYPGIIASAVIAHYVCIYRGVDLQLSTYGPVLFGALMVTVLERKYPHRESWLADRESVLHDSAYMLLVQILLPRFLSFFIAVTLLRTLASHEITINHAWPHEWPMYAQVILMLLCAEFMRYWVHRLAHTWPALWRLHAVHHSPHKLYWMNVGRFHPFEKAIQFLFDALPFIVLGVSEHVLALYFVFYAINGFFQHCNIDLRLGSLNYIISGPELHRWHHSKFPEESNQNYGNNLIVWDLLFGTWFLPRDRLVDELGLPNRNYPLHFVAQLKAPFIKGLDSAE